MSSVTRRIRVRSGLVSLLCLIGAHLALAGCASVPPEVAQTHQREKEILLSLQKAHLAMVDSYVDKKLEEFEDFLFHKYGPAYRAHWMEAFEELKGREYDPAKDFGLLYNDLVAEYADLSAPIEAMRTKLRAAIRTEYTNALTAHKAVGDWLASLKKLNDTQRETIDGLLGAVKPGLSLDSVEQAVMNAKANVEAKLSDLASP